jgi:hypothetical protein
MKDDLEIWKDIPEHEGIYQVSNKGNVKSLRFNKEKSVKQYKDGGYNVVFLTSEGKQRKHKVHRLVAMAFIPNIENKPCVDHINTIRDDNRVENLKWVTYKENSNNKLTRKHIAEARRGKIIYIPNDETKEKISKSLGGHRILCLTTGEVFLTASEASRKYNLNVTNISNCCKGRRKSTGELNGQRLVWQYYD